MQILELCFGQGMLEGLQQPKDADPEWLISDSWEMLSDPEPGDEKECGY